MKRTMKFVSMLMLGLLVLLPVMNVEAKTEFTEKDWIVDGADGRGTVTAIDSNITKLTGTETDVNGQYHGPYSLKSTETLENGISEEVNVELDPEAWNHGEYFTLTISLNNASDEYVTETGIWAIKDGDVIYIYPTWDANNRSIAITEKGVYTFQYNFTKDEDANKVYFDFNIKLWDEVIGSIEHVDMEDPRLTASGDTKDPNTIVDIRKVWFNNIHIADGVNVYTNLPEKPGDPEVPVEPVEPEVPTEEVSKEEVNPETSDGIMLFIGLTVVSLGGVVLAYRRLHN